MIARRLDKYIRVIVKQKICRVTLRLYLFFVFFTILRRHELSSCTISPYGLKILGICRSQELLLHSPTRARMLLIRPRFICYWDSVPVQWQPYLPATLTVFYPFWLRQGLPAIAATTSPYAEVALHIPDYLDTFFMQPYIQ